MARLPRLERNTREQEAQEEIFVGENVGLLAADLVDLGSQFGCDLIQSVGAARQRNDLTLRERVDKFKTILSG